jgi:cytochrome c oxidase cbb3-type subunit III
MTWKRMDRRAAVATAAFQLALLLIGPMSSAAQDIDDAPSDEMAAARGHYIASCARCHGVNGGGGEGPPLARARLPRAPDDRALIRIMRGGIAGTGMSGSWWLSPGELELVAQYVRSLAPSGPDEAALLTGDPSRGRAVYEDADCARCHTIGGFGTGRGPDLSTVGGRRGAAHLREALVDPAAALPRGLTAMPSDFVDYLVIRVIDQEGDQLRGTRVNEDSFTIQIKDSRGVVHSFYKPDLQQLDREFDRSLMQSYRDRLTDDEIEDLVAYLASLTGTDLRGIS